MLPFSTDWFMTWQPNIHSSLFYNIYRFMQDHGRCEPIQSIVKAYRLYQEHVNLSGDEAALSLTRAWTLVRFFDSGMLQMTPCTRCGGHFVAHAHDPHQGFVCGLCQPPSRAGKTRRRRARRTGRCRGLSSAGRGAQAAPDGANRLRIAGKHRRAAAWPPAKVFLPTAVNLFNGGLPAGHS